jgi:hypothetical protein
MLGDGAALVLDRWHGDLRRLRDAAAGDVTRASQLLTEFPGIGPAGAGIFLREVQAVWLQVAPYADRLVQRGAVAVGLPTAPEDLAALAGSAPRRAQLTAALVRVAPSREAAAEVTAAAGP